MCRACRDSAERAGTEVVLWDSGSGTGSIFFFNYDYIDDDLRELIREPKFRQAVSHAFNRAAVQKSVYFNTGELTTGTHSPKASEFQINDTGAQLYQQWRDAYVEYNPDKAKQLLDELGVKDTNGDGLRELPNGKKLALRIDIQGDASVEAKSKDNQLIADLKAVGIAMTSNPIAPQAFDDQWNSGKLIAHSNWEVANVGISLIQPFWLIPVEATRWAPLEGQWYSGLGTGSNDEETDVDPWKRHPPRMDAEKDGPIAKLWDLYNRARVEPDRMKQIELVWEIEKLHISDGPFFMGCVANFPQVIVAKTGLRNVPAQGEPRLGRAGEPLGSPHTGGLRPGVLLLGQPELMTRAAPTPRCRGHARSVGASENELNTGADGPAPRSPEETT